MKKIIVVLVLAFATLASPAHAEFKWQHFGADPYAATRAEAMQKREAAFRAMGLPAPVIKQFMLATEKSGEKVRLVNGDKLSTMMSKGGIVRRDVTVEFVKPPVSGKMEYAAPAEKWQVTWEGKIYVVILPEICYNWSAIASPPPEKVVECAKVRITVPNGVSRTVRSTLIRKVSVPDFNCWGVIERQWRTGAPRDCDWCEWTQDGVIEMHRRYGGEFDFFHTSIYTMHPDVNASGSTRATEVTLVFPLAARDGGVAVCVEVDGKVYEAALVLPPTWKEGTNVTIPADFWFRPRVVNP